MTAPTLRFYAPPAAPPSVPSLDAVLQSAATVISALLLDAAGAASAHAGRGGKQPTALLVLPAELAPVVDAAVVTVAEALLRCGSGGAPSNSRSRRGKGAGGLARRLSAAGAATRPSDAGAPPSPGDTLSALSAVGLRYVADWGEAVSVLQALLLSGAGEGLKQPPLAWLGLAGLDVLAARAAAANGYESVAPPGRDVALAVSLALAALGQPAGAVLAGAQRSGCDGAAGPSVVVGFAGAGSTALAASLATRLGGAVVPAV